VVVVLLLLLLLLVLVLVFVLVLVAVLVLVLGQIMGDGLPLSISVKSCRYLGLQYIAPFQRLAK